MKDGPLEGAITTEIIVDREGKVRDVRSILSDNPGLSEFASKSIWAMQFKPYLLNDEPVQVVSRITMPFKTVRPAGVENFASARFYFEHGRAVSFPAAGNGQPYVLRATFQTKGSSGTLEDGKYEDTWSSEKEWRREASIGKSRFVRSRHGDKRYELADGPEAPILRFVFKALEPIPTIDTFVESDWRMKRDDVDGLKTIRVLAGYEAPDGTLDPEQARGYWFDDQGKLVKTVFRGIETRRMQFEDFQGFAVAHEVRVFTKGKVAMLIRVSEISPASNLGDNNFELRGHGHTGAFTDEIR